MREAILAVAIAAAAACGPKAPAVEPPGASEPAVAVDPGAGALPGDCPDGLIEVSASADCAPVVEGRKCPIEVSVGNLGKDAIAVIGASTDRGADAATAMLTSEYGSIFEDQSGNLVMNTMAQMQTAPVFAPREAFVLPGEEATFGVTTRFVEGGRVVTVEVARIPAGDVAAHVFAQADATGMDVAYAPVQGLGAIGKAEGTLVLWDRGDLGSCTASVTLSPAIEPAPFPLAEARKAAGGKLTAEEPSYSDTFGAWILQGEDGTWLVRPAKAEMLSHLGAAVFEAIDEAGGQNVRFKVPAATFAGKWKLEHGDGMYTMGEFLTASGEGILDVLRFMKEKGGLACLVNRYFFSSWYLEVEGAE